MKTSPPAATIPAAAAAPSNRPESEKINSYLSGLTFKRAVAILLASGVTLRALGVWDNSYLETAAIAATSGAAFGVWAVKDADRNLHTLSEGAFILGTVSTCFAVGYSLVVEGAFQFLAAVGSFITNQ